MDKLEWTEITARLNASYPGQELRPETTTEWFDELEPYPAERVWRAVRRCRREQSFRPTLAELIDAMLANAHEGAAEPSRYRAIEARDPDSPGVPPPASFRMALRNLLRRLPPDATEPPAGRSREQQLAMLEAKMAQDAAAEATPTAHANLDDVIYDDDRPVHDVGTKGGRL